MLRCALGGGERRATEAWTFPLVPAQQVWSGTQAWLPFADHRCSGSAGGITEAGTVPRLAPAYLHTCAKTPGQLAANTSAGCSSRWAFVALHIAAGSRPSPVRVGKPGTTSGHSSPHNLQPC